MNKEQAEKHVAQFVRLRKCECGQGWLLAVYQDGMWRISNDRESGMSWDEALEAKASFIKTEALKMRRLANGGH